MIADERQMLVERYCSGAMSAAEARDFVASLETDGELRRLVDAESVITGAVARDRATLPLGASTPGAGLLAALEASRVVMPNAAASTSWFSGAIVTVASIVGVLGVAAGVLVVAPMLEKSGGADASANRPATSIERAAPTSAASSADAVPTDPDAARDAAGHAAGDAAGDAAARRRATESPTTREGADASTSGRSLRRHVPKEAAAARASSDAASPDRAATPSTARSEHPTSSSSAIDDRSPEDLPEQVDPNAPVQVDLKR